MIALLPAGVLLAVLAASASAAPVYEDKMGIAGRGVKTINLGPFPWEPIQHEIEVTIESSDHAGTSKPEPTAHS